MSLDMFADKPHCIRNTLPAELRLTFDDVAPEDIDMALAAPDCKILRKLPVAKQDGCYVWVTLDEPVAKFGAGRYLLQVYDGCELCDQIPIELKAECFISDVTQTGAAGKTKNNKCGTCNG